MYGPGSISRQHSGEISHNAISLQDYSTERLDSRRTSPLPSPSPKIPGYSVVQQHDANYSDEPKTIITKKSRKDRFVRFGWYWEIGAILAGIISTAAIVTVLAQIDGKPLSSWTYTIQPASLVAIFSTIAKSSLLVPVAVCLSQLKWSYFEKPRELGHMQVFDDASRGPWGAAVLLWKTKGVAWLASVGALITLFMMTFEPFSQQAIHVTQNYVRLRNETGRIAYSGDLSDLDYEYGAVPIPTIRLEFTIAMMEAMVGKSSVYAYGTECSRDECRFADFISLGACTKCETESVNVNNQFGCTYHTSSNTTNDSAKRQEYADFGPFRDAVTKYSGESLGSYGMDCSHAKEGFPTLYMNMEVQANNNTWGLLRGMGRPKESSPNSTTLSNDAVFGNTYLLTNGSHFYTAFRGSSLRFCTSSFNDGSKAEFDTIDTFTCFETSFNPGEITKLDSFGQFKGNLTHCRLSVCAQEYHDVKVSNKTLKAETITEKPLQLSGNGSIQTDVQATTLDKMSSFVIGSKRIGYLVGMIELVLFSADFREFMNELTVQDNAGWADVFERIGGVATEYIRVRDHSLPAGRLGGAYGLETFYKVVWPWVVMPLLMVSASILLLVATAVYSRHKRYLFKNSVLAGMRYGVQGWQPDQTNVGRETYTDLARTAQGVRARLVSGKDGELRFVKE